MDSGFIKQGQTTPYDPVDLTDIVIDGLNVAAVVADIRSQGYAVVEGFLPTDQVETIRAAFNTEVPITAMRAIGTATGHTWRAHNLLAKTRAADAVILDPRLRAIVDGVIGKYSQINIATLFNTLPGETKQKLLQDTGFVSWSRCAGPAPASGCFGAIDPTVVQVEQWLCD